MGGREISSGSLKVVTSHLKPGYYWNWNALHRRCRVTEHFAPGLARRKHFISSVVYPEYLTKFRRELSLQEASRRIEVETDACSAK
jgi:hypothetical protein